MTSQDAISHFLAHFSLIRAGADAAGNLEYDFDSPFHFVATELSDDLLQLAAPLPEIDALRSAGVDRLLLESGLQGASTGAGQIGLHPVLGLSLVEVIDCSQIGIDDLELRFVEFSLFAETWRTEGAALLGLDQPGTGGYTTDALTFRL